MATMLPNPGGTDMLPAGTDPELPDDIFNGDGGLLISMLPAMAM